MALVVITVPPAPTDEAMYDAVNAKLGDEMPEGLLVHTSGRNENGEFQIIDVWESREAHDRFTQGRLWDAIKSVASDRGMDMEGAPEARRVFYEAHSVAVRQPETAAPRRRRPGLHRPVPVPGEESPGHLLVALVAS